MWEGRQEIGEGGYKEDFNECSYVRIKFICLGKIPRGDSAKFVPFGYDVIIILFISFTCICFFSFKCIMLFKKKFTFSL